MSAPEYVKCIRVDAQGREHTAWCGRVFAPFDFYFESVDHAVLNGEQNGRLVACPRCVDKVVAALRNGAP